jgi:UDP-N-acetyl-D-mannosaminuronic acid dehydrogenase
MSFDTISVIGLGYIGLPTAAILASRKKKVIGVDVNEKTVDTINRGKIHIVEPELDMVVHATVGDLVILESTSPVGATEQMATWLSDARPELTFPQTHGEESDIRIAHCPERVLPGHVIRELVENDRVIGGMTSKCSKAAASLYKIFVEGECVITTARTAEMAKLTENSFRDVNIAFANELSIICGKLDINVWELIRLANRHPRVNILQPGPGVGGHCIAVDPWFIVNKTPEEAQLIRTAREVNDGKPEVVVNTILAHAEALKTKQIVCLGATFKPDIDDLRESPSVAIVSKLAHMGYDVQLVEPNIKTLPEALVTAGCQLVSLKAALIEGKDKVIAVLVAHKEFKASEPLRQNALLDFCGALNES